MNSSAAVIGRAWRWSNRLLPKGWLDLVRQILLFAAAYYLYRIVRGMVDGKAADAFENARVLVDVERSLNLFFEADLQNWALSSASFIVDAANFLYVNAHIGLTLGFLVWLYLRRNDSFYFVRNMFMIAMGLALVLYMLFPTAPPRFFPEWGFTDTVTSAVGDKAAASADLLYNPFAAIPSMHVAFALMVGIPASKLVKTRAVKWLWYAYPMMVTMIVVLTANHWWIDALIGALVAGLSAALAREGLARLRPEAWAWRQRAGAQAPA